MRDGSLPRDSGKPTGMEEGRDKGETDKREVGGGGLLDFELAKKGK